MCVTIKTLAQEFYGHLWYVVPGRHRKSRGRAQNILISLFFSISVNICCCSDSKLVGRTIYIYMIYIYIYMSDDQNARTRVLWTLVVRFAWEAQESARAGAKYISIVVLYICCCSDAKLVGRTDGTIWDVKTNLISSAISLEMFSRFSQRDKARYRFKACYPQV